MYREMSAEEREAVERKMLTDMASRFNGGSKRKRSTLKYSSDPMEPPEPAVVTECDKCGGEICEGDSFLDIPGAGRYCEDCVDGWKRFAELPEMEAWS